MPGNYTVLFSINHSNGQELIEGKFEVFMRKTSVKTKKLGICRINAEKASIIVNGTEFNDKNKLKMKIKEIIDGEGKISAKGGKNRFLYKFDIRELIENNSEMLVFDVNGDYRQRNIIIKGLNATIFIDKDEEEIRVVSNELNATDFMIADRRACEFIFGG